MPIAIIPAARTFVSLYTEALRVIGGSTAMTEAVTVTKEGINNGIRWFNTRTWRSFGRKSEDVTFVAGTSDYALATQQGFKDASRFLLLNATSNGKVNGRLLYLPPERFDQLFVNRETSTWPSHYTVYNFVADNQLSLSSPPDASFVSTHPKGRLHMYVRLNVLSGDSDVHGGDSDIEPLLVAVAELHLIRRYDPDRYSEGKDAVDDLKRTLIAADARYGTRDWHSHG